MATTQKNVDQGNADYAAAFNEPEGGEVPGGMTPTEQPEAQPEPEEQGAPAPAQPEPPAAAAVNPADADGQNTSPEASVDGPGMDMAKEMQRMKSWEGRLKKMEADLKKGKSTVETPAQEALEQVSEEAEDEGNEQLSEAAEELSEKVESGEMSPEEAINALTEDFGEPFVKMIEIIARKIAGEAGSKSASDAMGSLSQKTQDIIDHIQSKDERAHFKSIAAAHPDFREIADSEGFKAWLAEDPKREEVAGAGGGDADAVVKLIQDYKASTGATDTQTTDGDPSDADDSASNDDLDAAEGVSSTGGLKLPDEPANANDYESSWSEFDKKDRAK